MRKKSFNLRFFIIMALKRKSGDIKNVVETLDKKQREMD